MYKWAQWSWKLQSQYSISIYIGRYKEIFSHKKNTILPFVASWENLEGIVCVCVCVCVCKLSHIWLFATPWTVVHGILQTRILEWVAIFFSRASSWPRDGTRISYASCFGRQVLYHCINWEVLWGHYAKLSISENERQMPYNLTYM